jgi:6-phosphogluconolactonase
MRLLRLYFTFTAALMIGCGLGSAEELVYVGGYGNGIYGYRFQAASGRITRIGVEAETPKPSFLVVHPNGRFLYAANETGAAEDSISAFAIDRASGKLTALNKVSARGSAPCHLAIDGSGRWLAVANYSSGNIAVFPVQADGRLGPAAAVDQHHGTGPNAARQKSPHAHSVVFSPDNRFLLSADLGADSIFVYRFDAATGAIAPNDPPSAAAPAGGGPRHLVFHPSGEALYALLEMGSAITTFRYDRKTGSLDRGATVSMLPVGFNAPNTGAEVAVNAAGTKLYASNRGQDSIALFAIDPQSHALTFTETEPSLGKTPRFFTLDPSGAFLLVANQDSDNLVVFSVHPRTGELRPVGPVVNGVTKPTCIAFVP